MTGQGETVLRQRVCDGCSAVFWICPRCDRGQRYCSPACRAAARLQQHRSANGRHQRTPEGRLDHRDRQQRYRRRLAQETVTDQGSISIPDPARFGCGNSASLPLAPQATAVVPCRFSPAPELWHRCVVCGCTGRVVIPFCRFRPLETLG